jgi:hypothetical protein
MRDPVALEAVNELGQGPLRVSRQGRSLKSAM